MHVRQATYLNFEISRRRWVYY